MEKTHTIELCANLPRVIRDSDNTIVRVCQSVDAAIRFCERNGFAYSLFY